MHLHGSGARRGIVAGRLEPRRSGWIARRWRCARPSIFTLRAGRRQDSASGGYYAYDDDDDDNSDAAAVEEVARSRRLAAARQARAEAIASSEAEAMLQRARVEAYIASRGLGAISEFRGMAEEEAQRTLKELKEADIAALEARIAAEGGDLEADWAAVETSGRSTTGIAKAAGRGTQRGAPLPTHKLLEPPSNPRVDRLRAQTQEPRRRRRLFDSSDDDDGLWGNPYSSSGSDEDGPVGAARPPSLQRPPLPPFPRRVPQLAQSRDAEDLDALLDSLYEDPNSPLYQGTPEAVATGGDAVDDDGLYDDDGYDEYGRRRPGANVGKDPNNEYSGRIVRALRGALTDDDVTLAAKPSRPGDGSGPSRKQEQEQQRNRGGARFSAATPGSEAAQYDALLELLEAVGGDDDGDDLDAPARNGVGGPRAQPGSSSGSSGSIRRPVTTTALLRDEESSEIPRAPDRPRPPASRRGVAAGVGAKSQPPASQAGRGGAIVDGDAAFLEELLSDDSFLSELTLSASGSSSSRIGGAEQQARPASERRVGAGGFPNSDIMADGDLDLESLLLPDPEGSANPRLPTLESKPVPRGRPTLESGVASPKPSVPRARGQPAASAAAAESSSAAGGTRRKSAGVSAQSLRDQEELLRDGWDSPSFGDDVDAYDTTGTGRSNRSSAALEAGKDTPQLLERPTKSQAPQRNREGRLSGGGLSSGGGTSGGKAARGSPASPPASVSSILSTRDLDAMMAELSAEREGDDLDLLEGGPGSGAPDPSLPTLARPSRRSSAVQTPTEVRARPQTRTESRAVEATTVESPVATEMETGSISAPASGEESATATRNASPTPAVLAVPQPVLKSYREAGAADSQGELTAPPIRRRGGKPSPSSRPSFEAEPQGIQRQQAQGGGPSALAEGRHSRSDDMHAHTHTPAAEGNDGGDSSYQTAAVPEAAQAWPTPEPAAPPRSREELARALADAASALKRLSTANPARLRSLLDQDSAACDTAELIGPGSSGSNGSDPELLAPPSFAAKGMNSIQAPGSSGRRFTRTFRGPRREHDRLAPLPIPMPSGLDPANAGSTAGSRRRKEVPVREPAVRGDGSEATEKESEAEGDAEDQQIWGVWVDASKRRSSHGRDRNRATTGAAEVIRPWRPGRRMPQPREERDVGYWSADWGGNASSGKWGDGALSSEWRGDASFGEAGLEGLGLSEWGFEWGWSSDWKDYGSPGADVLGTEPRGGQDEPPAGEPPTGRSGPVVMALRIQAQSYGAQEPVTGIRRQEWAQRPERSAQASLNTGHGPMGPSRILPPRASPHDSMPEHGTASTRDDGATLTTTIAEAESAAAAAAAAAAPSTELEAGVAAAASISTPMPKPAARAENVPPYKVRRAALRTIVSRGELLWGYMVSFDPTSLTARVHFPALARLSVPQPVTMTAEQLSGWRKHLAAYRLEASVEIGAEGAVGDDGVVEGNGNASGQQAAAVRRGLWAAVTRITRVNQGAAGQEGSLGVEVVEVVRPRPHRWRGHRCADERKLIRDSQGQPVFAKVVALTERGAYCELNLAGGSAAAAGSQAEGEGADGTAASKGTQPRALLCFLPREAMTPLLETVWEASVVQEKAERRRLVMEAAGLTASGSGQGAGRAVTEASASQGDPAVRPPLLMRLGDTVEARLEGSSLSMVSREGPLVLVQLGQVPYKPTPALGKALGITP